MEVVAIIPMGMPGQAPASNPRKELKDFLQRRLGTPLTSVVVVCRQRTRRPMAAVKHLLKLKLEKG